MADLPKLPDPLVRVTDLSGKPIYCFSEAQMRKPTWCRRCAMTARTA